MLKIRRCLEAIILELMNMQKNFKPYKNSKTFNYIILLIEIYSLILRIVIFFSVFMVFFEF
jgi:hypothetical protein